MQPLRPKDDMKTADGRPKEMRLQPLVCISDISEYGKQKLVENKIKFGRIREYQLLQEYKTSFDHKTVTPNILGTLDTLWKETAFATSSSTS